MKITHQGRTFLFSLRPSAYAFRLSAPLTLKGWQVIEERDGTGVVTQQYVYGRYIDEPLTRDDRSGGQTVSDLNDGSGSDRLFYYCNTQYSTFALTDETGTIVEGYQYDAYGRQTVITGNGDDGEWFTDDDTLTVGAGSDVENPYMFQGRRFDVESGMYYYRNRYYNSRLGRFITRDPMGVWYDSFGYGSGYTYLSQNPSNKLDRYGFWPRDRHADFVRTAFRQYEIKHSSEVSQDFINQVVEENKWTDEGNVLGMIVPFLGSPLEAHYNRSLGADEYAAEETYKEYLREKTEKFINAARKGKKEEAIDAMGAYTHARQDFYSHAAPLNQRKQDFKPRTPEGWNVWSEGNDPSPMNPVGTHPSSYPAEMQNFLLGGVFPFIQPEQPEHLRSKEPVFTPTEKSRREVEARKDTYRQIEDMMRIWRFYNCE